MGNDSKAFPSTENNLQRGKGFVRFLQASLSFEYLIKSVNYFIVYWMPCCSLDAGRVSFLRGSTTSSGVQLFTLVAVIKRI